MHFCNKTVDFRPLNNFETISGLCTFFPLEIIFIHSVAWVSNAAIWQLVSDMRFSMVVAYFGCFDSKKMTSLVAYLLLKKPNLWVVCDGCFKTPKQN